MSKNLSLKKIARNVLNTNQYMTLGTVNEAGKPWVSPVVYAFDSSYNLYFVSLPSSSHTKSIKRDPALSVAIFDSHQLNGEGVGLQILGEAQVVPARDFAKAFKCCVSRKFPYGGSASATDFKKFMKLYKYRFYKIKPVEIWMNDPRKKYDARVRVRL